MYINKIFYGAGANGIAKAADTYFGKTLDELTLVETATLAGLPQSPTNYNPFNYPERAEERRNTVLTLMNKHGYISESEMKEAKEVPIEDYLLPEDKRGGEDTTAYDAFIDAVLDEIDEWQKRPLKEVYPIVFIDAVHFNVKQENVIVKKAAYVILGVTTEGFKEVLGIWIGENESAKYWLGTLNELKNRGVKDILIICSDGLKGINEAIKAVYPNAMQQRCIVHLIRNSVKFVSYKHLKEFCNDLRTIYKSNNEKEARENLDKVKDKWSSIYPTSLKVWEDNWEAICTLFNYSKELRRIMYTTNAIESLNRSYRKYTKTKGVFTSDNSLMKCLFLATKNVEKKWTTRYPNWDMIYNELNILYPERLN